jgi:MSHA biogenesis protein MshP
VSGAGRRSGPVTAQHHARARGFSLIVTLFVILVLAGLGAFALQVALTQQQTASFGLLNARAQAAANSGIEYGANQALLASSCPASTTLNLTAIGLAGFAVTVTCSASTHDIKGTLYQAYVLTATAQLGTYGTSGYVAGSATRTVTNAPP